jgi:phosphoribosyl 1,2-cyclic phosphodiesterase
VKVTLWGTRGSQASPGPDTVRYGGNTSCVAVETGGHVVVLDAGTGIRVLGRTLDGAERIDVLLTHLHMDHIQGLGFFAPLFQRGVEVHVWGPASTMLPLRARLSRYLSPPLFPVRLRDVPCRLTLHDVPFDTFSLPGCSVTAELVCHPGPTVGYRIDTGDAVLTYLPDHEPALGVRGFPREQSWTSGASLADGADLLIHDSQYRDEEYSDHIGWGHSALSDSVAFARQARVRQYVTFHHDPWHSDDALDMMVADAMAEADGLLVVAGREGLAMS